MDTATNTARKRKKTLKSIVRFSISVLLLIIVYSRVDRQRLFSTLAPLTWQTVAILVLVYAVGQALSALKWRMFLECAGIERSAGDAIRSYFFGMYVNTFALGTVGGDLARALAVQPEQGKRVAALSTVVADRIHGLIVLVAIGIVGIALNHPPILGAFAVPAAIACLLALVCMYWIGPKVLTMIFPAHHRLGEMATRAANAFPRSGRAFFLVTVISLLFHLSQIYTHAVIAENLQAPLTFAYLLATVPFVNIACSLPISIGGLGVRESMYLFLFTPIGVSQELCIAIGALWFVTTTIVAAIGGVLLVPRLRSEIEEELRHEEEEGDEVASSLG